MPNASKIALLKSLIESAQSNLNSAKQILLDICSDGNLDKNKKYIELAEELSKSDEDGKYIEGVFDGQSMIGPNSKVFPVPANYASKSKLIEGDILKLSISEDGTFLYKQIGPAPRRRLKGPLISEGNQFYVLAEGKNYKVLLASVTYFHGEVGDEVIILVPELEDSQWAAIENIAPKISSELNKEIEISD